MNKTVDKNEPKRKRRCQIYVFKSSVKEDETGNDSKGPVKILHTSSKNSVNEDGNPNDSTGSGKIAESNGSVKILHTPSKNSVNGDGIQNDSEGQYRICRVKRIILLAPQKLGIPIDPRVLRAKIHLTTGSQRFLLEMFAILVDGRTRKESSRGRMLNSVAWNPRRGDQLIREMGER